MVRGLCPHPEMCQFDNDEVNNPAVGNDYLLHRRWGKVKQEEGEGTALIQAMAKRKCVVSNTSTTNHLKKRLGG